MDDSNNIKNPRKDEENKDQWFEKNRGSLNEIGKKILVRFPDISGEGFMEKMNLVLERADARVTEKQSEEILKLVIQGNSTPLSVDITDNFKEKEVNKHSNTNNNNIYNMQILQRIKLYNKTILLILAIILLLSNLIFLIYRNNVITSRVEKRTIEYRNKFIEFDKRQEFIKGKLSQIKSSSARYLEYELNDLQQTAEKVGYELYQPEEFVWYE